MSHARVLRSSPECTTEESASVRCAMPQQRINRSGQGDVGGAYPDAWQALRRGELMREFICRGTHRLVAERLGRQRYLSGAKARLNEVALQQTFSNSLHVSNRRKGCEGVLVSRDVHDRSVGRRRGSAQIEGIAFNARVLA